MTSVEILKQMGERGLKVNRVALESAYSEAGFVASIVRVKFKEDNGFDALSHKIPFMQGSSAAAFLERSSHPLAAEVIRVRKLSKRAQNLSTMLNAIGPDGRVHWEWKTAKTNRVYATNQMLTLGKDCRQFILPDSGEFVVLDYRQQELRIIAALLHSQTLVDLIEADIHAATAEVLGWTRERAKTLHYALLYGTDVETVAERNDVTDEQMRKVLDNLPVDQLKALGKARARNGKVQTLGGTWLAYDTEDENSRTNTMCQGSGADILMQGLEILANQFGMLPVMVIHDAFMLDVDGLTAEKVYEMAHALEVEWGGVKFPVEVKRGKTWAEVS